MAAKRNMAATVPRRRFGTAPVQRVWAPLLTGAALGAALWLSRHVTRSPPSPSPPHEAPSPPTAAAAATRPGPARPRRSGRAEAGGVVVGIDLGSLAVRVAAPTLDGGRLTAVRVLENTDGARATPAFFAFDASAGAKAVTLLGAAARRRWQANPAAAVWGAHLYLGRRFDDPVVQALRALGHAPVERAGDGGVLFVLDGGTVSPVDVIADLLSAARMSAQGALGHSVTAAAVAVPQSFDAPQREALARAMDAAGLEPLLITSDVPAAVTGHLFLTGGLPAVTSASGSFLVFDGGATARVATVTAHRGRLTVGAAHVGPLLGHLDADRRFVRHVAELFGRQHGIDLLTDPLAVARLADAAEAIKIELATKGGSSLNLPFITADASGPKHLRAEWTRSRYEAVLQPLWDEAERLVRAAMIEGDAARPIAVVAGGLGRMPRLVTAVEQVLATAATANRDASGAPEELVAVGTAVLAYLQTQGR